MGEVPFCLPMQKTSTFHLLNKVYNAFLVHFLWSKKRLKTLLLWRDKHHFKYTFWSIDEYIKVNGRMNNTIFTTETFIAFLCNGYHRLF